MGDRAVGGRSKEEGTYVELIHFLVQQKLTQHCKATIPHFLKNCLSEHKGRHSHRKFCGSSNLLHATCYAQPCLTLWNPRDCSPPGFSVHGILQTRILGWVAVLFSRGSSWPRVWTWVSCIAGRFFTIWATREALTQQQKTHNLSAKRAEESISYFPKEDMQKANRHMKRCSTSLIVRGVQIKTTMKGHLTPVRMAMIIKTRNNKC